MLLDLHSRITQREKEGNELLNKMLTSMGMVNGFGEAIQLGEKYHNEASHYYNLGDLKKAFEFFLRSA